MTIPSLLRPPRAGTGILNLLAPLLLAGCGGRETIVQQATREGIMIVGNFAEPAGLDPHTSTGVPEDNVFSTLFEGLTQLDPVTLEALPGAAERWEVSPDGLLYTFHLRPGLTWSDGTPLSAPDFLAGFRRVLAPTLGSDNADGLYFVVNAEAFHKGRIQDFDQVGFRLPDDRTVEIRLRHPTPFLPKAVSSRAWFPIPRHVISKYGDPHQRNNDWTRPGHLVGNGPFILQEWKPNVHIEVRRNPAYWDAGRVRLKGVRFLPLDNQAAEEAAFRAGQMHKTSRVPINKIAAYQREAPDRLHIHPYSGVYYFNFNVTRPPFDDVRVRQALALAVDRERIVRHVTQGGETPAYHFTPEGVGGYVSRARTRLDFEAARRLLAEAGFPGGRGLGPITLLYNTADNHRAIAEVLQQTWKLELGIELKLENQEWKVYLDSVQGRFYQIARAGLIMEPYDPSQFLRVFTSDSGFNRTGWSDPEYDRLYEEVLHTVDGNQRLELMQRMEEILTAAMPILPVYYYTNSYLMDPSVQGWTNNLLAFGPYSRVWLQ
jgi:oligopeptide transport system substrate-binding protein